jgi:hypothetical protein
MFWICGERYSGSGRISRTWIEEAEKSPAAERPCLPDCMIYEQRGSGACGEGGGCIPYPFNGMGGFVAGGFNTEEQAQDAEDALWAD